jgi:hypothetical protein
VVRERYQRIFNPNCNCRGSRVRVAWPKLPGIVALAPLRTPDRTKLEADKRVGVGIEDLLVGSALRLAGLAGDAVRPLVPV